MTEFWALLVKVSLTVPPSRVVGSTAADNIKTDLRAADFFGA